jgi:hypothetical protein
MEGGGPAFFKWLVEWCVAKGVAILVALFEADEQLVALQVRVAPRAAVCAKLHLSSTARAPALRVWYGRAALKAYIEPVLKRLPASDRSHVEVRSLLWRARCPRVCALGAGRRIETHRVPPGPAAALDLLCNLYCTHLLLSSTRPTPPESNFNRQKIRLQTRRSEYRQKIRLQTRRYLHLDLHTARSTVGVSDRPAVRCEQVKNEKATAKRSFSESSRRETVAFSSSEPSILAA